MGSAEYSTIAVLGPGLLGGSVAKAVASRWSDVKIRLWGRRREVLQTAAAEGLCGFADTDVSKVVEGADLIVLATPVGVMAEVMGKGLSRMKEAAVVTDVGSVKESVVAALAAPVAQAGGHFVGSHPMAGSEKTGIAFSRADLFEGAACIVTPTAEQERGAVESVARFWQSLGAKVTEMAPAEHDRFAAKISHVPHAMASLLVNLALAEDPEIANLSGRGFRDTTRVAGGDAAMWVEILLENRGAVVALLRALGGEVSALVNALEMGDEQLVFQTLDRAQRLRQSCPPPAAPDSQATV